MYRLIFITLVALIFFVQINSIKEVSSIIGGKEAGRTVIKNWGKQVHTTTEFPYIAALELKKQTICGAVIIKADTLLTAAHCVKGTAATKFTVRAGTFTKGDETGKYVQNREVLKKVVHEKYKSNEKKHYDLAILKLKKKFHFNDYVKTVEIAEASQVDAYNFENVIALGFGEMENGIKSDTLRRADVKVLSKGTCREKNIHIMDNTICTMGYEQPAGICTGDSGSPLIARHNPLNPKNDVLIGIASHCISNCKSPTKCDLDFSSFYTDISLFRKWIDGNI